MNTALGPPAARYTTPAVTTAAGGFSPSSGLACGPVPSAAQSSIGDGGRWTLRHSPAFAAAFDPSAMVPA
jgi:hypothetical protein